MKIQQYHFFQQIYELPFVQKIILYGSRARGDNQERSDIDLAIVCPEATKEQWRQVLQIIEDADTLLKIDCLRFDELSENNALREAIVREGVVLYDAAHRSKN